MKKFQFRLEKILKHKTRLFEFARGAHAEAVAQLRKEEAKLESLRKTYQQCLYDLARKTANSFKVSELGPFYRYMTFTKKDIAVQSNIVYEAMEKETKCRQELMKAAQEKEVLVKLRERQQKEHDYMINKEEQNFLDDIAAARFAREKRS